MKATLLTALTFLLLIAPRQERLDADSQKKIHEEASHGWVYLSWMDDSIFFIKKDGIHELDKGITEAWIKRRARKTGVWSETGIPDGTDEMLLHIKVDCSSRLLGTADRATYDKDGNLINVKKFDFQWGPVPPDTIGEIVFEYTCAKQPPKRP